MRRALVVLALAVVAALPACGGGSSSSHSATIHAYGGYGLTCESGEVAVMRDLAHREAECERLVDLATETELPFAKDAIAKCPRGKAMIVTATPVGKPVAEGCMK